ncbi:MAG: carboxypeptidase regulatory-like domain-containing protein [Gemmatimonadaceae bacterium]
MRKSGQVLALAAGLALTLAGSRSLFAQGVTTGAISGTVTDSTGRPLENAQVQVVNRVTGATTGASTRGTGLYYAQGLETGRTYTITVRLIGYAPQTRNNIVVQLSQTTRQDFRLIPQATVLAGVTVQAAGTSDIISPTRTGAATTISDSSLRQLPSLNRNFTDFVALTPQVSTTAFNGGLSAGGVNNRFNQIQIDGASETDLFGLGSTGQPGGQASGKSISIESVKEYQVLLAPFDIRNGNFAGLLINAVTQSGTNEFHGKGYFYGRNESFTRSQTYIPEFKQQQYGFTLSGPIIRDKILFFLNPDFQAFSTPTTGFFVGGPGSPVQQADVDRFSSILSSQYGITGGSAGQIQKKQPQKNFFGRLDFQQLPFNSTLVIRDNYADAQADVLFRDATGTAPNVPLSSNAYFFSSKKNGLVTQLRTNLAGGSYNELIAGFTTIRDRRAPRTRTPQITEINATSVLVAGGERSSHANELDQNILEVTDNYTYPVGNHNLLVGTQNYFYKVRNLFAQNKFGAYTFDNLDSLASGAHPSQYLVGVPISGDGAVRFTAQEFSLYAQDMWNATPRFTLTAGIRADIPRFTDRPPTNASVLTQFNRNTADIPTSNIAWSPRVGFNWDITGDQRNQFRGGVGAFAGHPAYVWLSNAFQNSGLTGVAQLTCNRSAGNTPPPLNAANIASPPQMCLNGLSAAASAEIDLLSPNLHFPQSGKADLAYDRVLPRGLIGTIEGLYQKAIYAPFYQNIALAGPQGLDRNGRVMYGLLPGAPTRKVAARGQVFDVTDENKDYNWSATVQLTKRQTGRFGGSLAYNYSQAFDVGSLTSSTAFSQYRFSRVQSGNEAEQNITPGGFGQTHRIVGIGSYTLPTKTTLTAQYLGQSGVKYTYISSADLNADGTTLNDPIYIPRNASDVNEMRFAPITTGSGATLATLFTAAQEAAALDQFITSNPCLNRQRGQIMTRNSCEAPWTHVVNLAIRQALPTLRGQNVELQLDIINFGNLINKKWGHQLGGAFQPPITLLTCQNTACGATGSLLAGSGQYPTFQYDPRPAQYSFQNVESQYQMQLSLRYIF